MKVHHDETCKHCKQQGIQHKLHNRGMKGSKGVTKTIKRCHHCRKEQ